MQQPFWITTSWDDGHQLDLRMADLLDRYNLTGTFYVARDYLPERLSEAEIAQLSERHEIGAHTLTHPILTDVDDATARREISDSRRWLQDVTGKPITIFRFPRGFFNQKLLDLVKEAGYEAMLGVEEYHLTLGDDPFNVPCTVHVYPFPFRPIDSLRARFQPIRRIIPHLPRLRIPLTALRNWPSLAIALLERASETGGLWHLWGHSWEVEKYGMWGELETVLAEVTKYPQVRPVTNSQLAREISTSKS